MSQLDEHGIETYKSMISLSTEAFKALQFLNGGAIVALLAYLGQSSGRGNVARLVAYPVALFVLGLVTATLAYGTAYLTQFSLYNEGLKRPSFLGANHRWWLALTFVIALASLGFFGLGSFASLTVLASSS